MRVLFQIFCLPLQSDHFTGLIACEYCSLFSVRLYDLNTMQCYVGSNPDEQHEGPLTDVSFILGRWTQYSEQVERAHSTASKPNWAPSTRKLPALKTDLVFADAILRALVAVQRSCCHRSLVSLTSLLCEASPHFPSHLLNCAFP